MQPVRHFRDVLRKFTCLCGTTFRAGLGPGWDRLAPGLAPGPGPSGLEEQPGRTG